MRKLTLSLLVVVIVAMLGIGWALDGLFERYFDSDDRFYSSAYLDMGRTLATIVDRQDDSSALPQPMTTDAALRLSITPLHAFPLPEELESSFINGEPLALESDGESTLSYYLPKRQQVLTLVTSTVPVKKGITHLRIFFTASFYGGITVLLLMWLYPLISRLIKLKNTSLAFGKGDLSQRVDTHSMSYITEIETAFNQMAQRIQTLVNDNKLLGNAVSHDLRTPLARLRFGIDALSETTDTETQINYQKRISNDIDEMESLVETLLNYARLDQSMVAIDQQHCHFIEIIQACIKNLSENDIRIDIVYPENDLIVTGNRQYLSMLINNLLSNARQHARTQVKVICHQSAQGITLLIDDDGTGIDPSEIDNILKPFMKGSTNQASAGYGMGLAIAKRIAEWHHGKLAIDRSRELGGASIQVTIPHDSLRK